MADTLNAGGHPPTEGNVTKTGLAVGATVVGCGAVGADGLIGAEVGAEVGLKVGAEVGAAVVT